MIWLDTIWYLNDNSPLNFGGVPEWPKGADCKSAGSTFGGSNPPPSTKGLSCCWLLVSSMLMHCGCSSMVELQPSKLNTWVRFPSPAPFQRRSTGREISWLQILIMFLAHIAQSVEHFLGKEEVTGSNPVMGSIILALFFYLKFHGQCLFKNIFKVTPDV